MYKIIKQTISSNSIYKTQRTLLNCINNNNNNNNRFNKIFYSTFSFKDNSSIDKQNLKKLIESNDKNYVLIDVRNPAEVESTFLIPTAIHIPLGALPAALSMSENEYQEVFEKEKFKIDDNIIFYCLKGKRSELAVDFAKGLGYRNVINYPGSFEDWVSN